MRIGNTRSSWVKLLDAGVPTLRTCLSFRGMNFWVTCRRSPRSQGGCMKLSYPLNMFSRVSSWGIVRQWAVSYEHASSSWCMAQACSTYLTSVRTRSSSIETMATHDGTGGPIAGRVEGGIQSNNGLNIFLHIYYMCIYTSIRIYIYIYVYTSI